MLLLFSDTIVKQQLFNVEVSMEASNKSATLCLYDMVLG